MTHPAQDTIDRYNERLRASLGVPEGLTLAGWRAGEVPVPVPAAEVAGERAGEARTDST